MNDLILLHGALGTAETLRGPKTALTGRYAVHCMDFPGHGTTGGDEGPAWSVSGFGDAVIRMMDARNLETADLFGYSMGGYVALHLARHHPARIRTIATLGTKLHWDPATAAREVTQLNPDAIAAKVPRFAAGLQALHGHRWPAVVSQTADLLRLLGADPPLKEADFRQLTQRVLLLRGDRDAMASLAETVAVYEVLQTGSLGILPGTPHPLEKVDHLFLADVLHRFLSI